LTIYKKAEAKGSNIYFYYQSLAPANKLDKKATEQSVTNFFRSKGCKDENTLFLLENGLSFSYIYKDINDDLILSLGFDIHDCSAKAKTRKKITKAKDRKKILGYLKSVESNSTKRSPLEQLNLLARSAPKVDEEKATSPKTKIMLEELEREAMVDLQSRFGSNLGQKHNEPWYIRVLKVGIKTFMAWSVLLLPVILFIVWMSWPKKTSPKMDSAKAASVGEVKKKITIPQLPKIFLNLKPGLTRIWIVLSVLYLIFATTVLVGNSDCIGFLERQHHYFTTSVLNSPKTAKLWTRLPKELRKDIINKNNRSWGYSIFDFNDPDEPISDYEKKMIEMGKKYSHITSEINSLDNEIDTAKSRVGDCIDPLIWRIDSKRYANIGTMTGTMLGGLALLWLLPYILFFWIGRGLYWIGLGLYWVLCWIKAGFTKVE
jgi:hypothetical protein